MGISEENLRDQLQHAAKLSSKHCGDLAEMIFMRKAASMGFGVSKPWGDSERYDFVLRAGKSLWRVQVKSVRAKTARGQHYRVALAGAFAPPYTADEIDFLVAYIFPEDAWYIFPISIVANRTVLCVAPKSKRSRWEQYREAWKLMQCRIESTAIQPAGEDSEGGVPKTQIRHSY